MNYLTCTFASKFVWRYAISNRGSVKLANTLFLNEINEV